MHLRPLAWRIDQNLATPKQPWTCSRDRVFNRVHPNTTTNNKFSKAQKKQCLPGEISFSSNKITHQHVNTHPRLDKRLFESNSHHALLHVERDKDPAHSSMWYLSSPAKLPEKPLQSSAPGGPQHKREHVIKYSQTKHLTKTSTSPQFVTAGSKPWQIIGEDTKKFKQGNRKLLKPTQKPAYQCGKETIRSKENRAGFLPCPLSLSRRA